MKNTTPTIKTMTMNTKTENLPGLIITAPQPPFRLPLTILSNQSMGQKNMPQRYLRCQLLHPNQLLRSPRI